MPTGELQEITMKRLKDIGEWMDINSEAIWDTMPQSPYAMSITVKPSSVSAGELSATAADWWLSRKDDAVYALLLLANHSLPPVDALGLLFVINLAGGID